MCTDEVDPQSYQPSAVLRDHGCFSSKIRVPSLQAVTKNKPGELGPHLAPSGTLGGAPAISFRGPPASHTHRKEPSLLRTHPSKNQTRSARRHSDRTLPPSLSLLHSCQPAGEQPAQLKRIRDRLPPPLDIDKPQSPPQEYSTRIYTVE